VKKKLLRVAKWVAYPLFYLLCLALFGYLSFPYEQLKTRIIAEFDRTQRRSSRGQEPMRLEIDDLDSYWFSGVEVTGARLIIPPKKRSSKKRTMSFGGGTKKDEPKKASVLTIDRVTARVQMLPLLIGDVQINFDAEAFGGEISGSLPVGADGGDVEIEFVGLQLLDVAPLQTTLEGIPLQGVASGAVSLMPRNGKFSKADGRLAVVVDTVKLGNKQKGDDGKLKDVVEMQGVELPSVLVGTINIEATAKDGLLTIEDFGAKGRDFELLGDGKVKLHESWDRSQADVYLKFRFSDSYRTKSDAATSLLGEPGAKYPPVIEAAPGSPFKRAKTEDEFYRFHINGALNKLDFKPAGNKSARGKKPRGKSRKATPSFGKKTFGKLRTPKLNRSRPQPPPKDEDDGEARPTPEPAAAEPAPREPAAREPAAREPAAREPAEPTESPATDKGDEAEGDEP